MSDKKDLVVSFSGGKTSGFMCHYLLESWAHKYNFTFCFANTGREHEETLKFAKKCDEYFGLNLKWLEAVTNPVKGKGVRHKIVNFETASRNGEPFTDYIKKEGVPNASRATCTERLKTFVVKSYMRDSGLLKRNRKGAKVAIGMRADEPSRCKLDSDAVKRHNLVYPLVYWGEEFDKQDVNTFWEDMPFNLEIPERHGNCLTCFKKSDNKLKLIAKEHPKWFSWCHEMEEKYGEGYVFFRGRKSTKDLMKAAEFSDTEILKHLCKSEVDDPSGCGESCEPFQ